MTDSDPQPGRKLFASVLLPELINKILDFMGIQEKRKGRLISPFWRDLIDARPEIVFRVKLNNKSAKWVQNMKPRFIQNLRVQGLTTTEFNYNIFQSKAKKINKVIIGPNNSGDHFWKILQLCDELSVECLKFEEHSTPVQGKDSNRLQITLPSVKTLEIEVGYFKNDIREPSAICKFLHKLSLPCLHHLDFKFGKAGLSFLDDDFQAFYNFLNRHNTVRRLQLSIFERCTTDTFFLLPLPGTNWFMSVRNIEELSLHLDFRTHRQVSPLIQHCKALKALTISHLQTSGPSYCYYNRETVSELYTLVSQNASTLESLSIESNYIVYSEIGLEKCTNLRILKLVASEFRFDPTSRIFPNVQSLEINYPPDFRDAQKFLELAASELKELTLRCYPWFDILHLRWILDKNCFPKIQQVVVSGMPFDIQIPPPIVRFVDETPGIKGEWIQIQNGTIGLREYCIRKLN